MAEKYWVPDGTNGTGNTSVVTHWDDASGGAGGDAVPGSGDDMNFDALSFLAAGQTVTVDATANCLDMDWTGATNTPTLAGTGNIVLNIYGSLTFISAMNRTLNLNYGIAFGATSTGKTVTWGGSFPNNQSVAFNGAGGGWTFQDDLNIGTGILRFGAGNTNTNGKTITCGDVNNQWTAAGTLTLGNSVINCTAWTNNSFTLTIPANTSTINCSGSFAGNSTTTFNTVNLTGATSTVTGNNTFKEIGLMRSGVQTITATGTTQTVFNMRRDAGIAVKTLVNGTYVNNGGRIIVLPYMSISGATFTPATKWYFPNSTDGGGNTGGIFNKYPPNGGGWWALRH